MSNVCAVCTTEAPFKCTACKNVSYCGVEHQKKHWKIHKPECRAFEIATTSDLDRYLCAKRDINDGSIIFIEPPVIFGPKWSLPEENDKNPILPCIGCFTPVRVGFTDKCPGCQWPACSSSCPKLTDFQHHGIECSILSLGRGPISEDIRACLDYYRTDAILILKCLLLQRLNKTKWEQLMEMQSHENDRLGTDLYKEADKRIVSYLQTNFLEAIRVAERSTGNSYLPDSSSYILHKICGIIEVNFKLIGLPNGQEISGVYPTGCIMEHSCIPNCWYSFDTQKNYKICVRAGRAIKQGEHLQVMYTHVLWGTQMRREHLKETKYFQCKCKRCADPTELGTYFSALKCIGTDLSSCGGYQLPTDPLDENSEWACDRCPVRISSDHQSFIISQMSEEVDTATIDRQGNVKELESLIDKFSQLLHKNHFHLFTLNHALIQMYGHQPGYYPNQMSDNLMQQKIEICHNLLSVVQVLDPYSIRLSFYTAIIYFELHLAIIQLTLRKNCDEQKDKLVEALGYAEKSQDIIQRELDSPQGKLLHERICKGVAELRGILEINHSGD